MMTDRADAPTFVLGLTAATCVAVLVGVGPPVQPALVGLFLISAPGTAVLLGVRSWPPLVWLTAVVSASMAIDLMLTSALFYAGWWSPSVVLGCLVMLCVGCALSARVGAQQVVAAVGAQHWRRHRSSRGGHGGVPATRPRDDAAPAAHVFAPDVAVSPTGAALEQPGEVLGTETAVSSTAAVLQPPGKAGDIARAVYERARVVGRATQIAARSAAVHSTAPPGGGVSAEADEQADGA